MILFGLSVNPYDLLIFAFLSSIGLACAFPSIEGILVDISPKRQKGEIAGVWSFAEDFGYLLGPLSGGLVAFYFGVNNAFTFIGIILIISVFPVLKVFRAIPKQHP